MTKAEARAAYQALMKFYPLTLEDLPGELWEDIAGYGGYQVSTFGRVKSFKYKTPRIMVPQLRGKYLFVGLTKGIKTWQVSIHRLVAICFIPNPEGKPQINHRDGHRLNNFVSNLEWCTGSENVRHAVGTGLIKLNEERSDSKLTNEQALYIRENTENITCVELAEKFNVSSTTVARVQCGRIYQSVGGDTRTARPQKYLTAEQVLLVRNNPCNLTQKQLAEMFGVDQTTISLVQIGKSYPQLGGIIRESKRNQITDDLKAQILSDYQPLTKGHGFRTLAKKYGISSATVWKIIRGK